MAGALIAFDLRLGQIFVGDGEQLGRLLRPVPPVGPDAGSVGVHQGQPAQSGEASTTTLNPNGHRTSVRDFARRFVHRKLYERIAILLYYAHRIEARSTLTSRDLSDWFGLCGFKIPVRMDKALDNVMRQRRIAERRGPGQWALTASGESVALDLLEPTSAKAGE